MNFQRVDFCYNSITNIFSYTYNQGEDLNCNIINQSHNSSYAKNEEEFFNGELVYLGSSFKDEMSLKLTNASELLKNKVLQKTVIKICKTVARFNFSESGFEFHDFSKQPLGRSIFEIAKDPTNAANPCWENRSFARAVENQMTIWGQSVGIPFSQVVWIDTVYRNTAEGKFGSVHFVHVDFPEVDHSQTLKGHSNWKDRVEEVVGQLNTEQYERLKISKIINIWLPLDKQLEAEPLAVLDVRSIKKESQLRTYYDERITTGDKYQSVGVFPDEYHQWYIKNKMKLGEGIIFDSCQTPHSAVSLPDQQNKRRTSLECRVIFIK